MSFLTKQVTKIGEGTKNHPEGNKPTVKASVAVSFCEMLLFIPAGFLWFCLQRFHSWAD